VLINELVFYLVAKVGLVYLRNWFRKELNNLPIPFSNHGIATLDIDLLPHEESKAEFFVFYFFFLIFMLIAAYCPFKNSLLLFKRI
jgi:hypothetical protein